MESGKLKPEDENIIQTNSGHLKGELVANDVTDFLFENKVITLNDKEKINKLQPKKTARNEELHFTILHSESGHGTFLPQNLKMGTILGHGAYGTVYLATIETKQGVKQIAVKQMNVTDPTRKQKFENSFKKETTALKQLSHERIVQYYGYSCKDLTYHIYIEYMPGGSLSEFITKSNAIEEAKARHLTQQMLEGIAYIHGVKLFHRDIKSSNVLMLDENTVKIADFGLTREYEDLTRSCTAEVGTYRFMAPEMLTSRYNRSVDIWAMGCVLLHMLTGQYPYHKLEQQQVLRKLMDKSSPMDDVSFDLSRSAKEFLVKMFQLDFKSRPSAESLLKDPFIVANGSNTESRTKNVLDKKIILELSDYMKDLGRAKVFTYDRITSCINISYDDIHRIIDVRKSS